MIRTCIEISFFVKPSLKCLGFKIFVVSLLLNCICNLEVFVLAVYACDFSVQTIPFLSNLHWLSQHMELVLVQHGIQSRFSQVHCPDLCPPYFLCFSFLTINCNASNNCANLFSLLIDQEIVHATQYSEFAREPVTTFQQ